ncbi:hypothetical protein DPMN_175531 [Dreissena polymorpha]|uniref:Uncharacterized protein n=1 Tax=Dreissena polymorpha TaxID=45954 RepID=A0A9D4IIU5_DREPO|nr:hypothetical protein DPMN_175531 [Dreissena polymorpha]
MEIHKISQIPSEATTSHHAKTKNGKNGLSSGWMDCSRDFFSTWFKMRITLYRRDDMLSIDLIATSGHLRQLE